MLGRAIHRETFNKESTAGLGKPASESSKLVSSDFYSLTGIQNSYLKLPDKPNSTNHAAISKTVSPGYSLQIYLALEQGLAKFLV